MTDDSDDGGRQERTGAPLEDLAATVEERRDGEGLIEESLVERIRAEDALSAGSDGAPGAFTRGGSAADPTSGEAPGAEPAGDDPDELFQAGHERREVATAEPVAGAEGVYRVPTADFCGSCDHLSAPAEMRCTHDGTAILALVDREHLRVKDCPIVERRERPGSHDPWG